MYLQLEGGIVQLKFGLLLGICARIEFNHCSKKCMAITLVDFLSVATLEHTIQTVASVGRIKWRPQRKNHIGSTALVFDTSVCVWDVRRPFVPFAAFEKHK